jgi:putative transposase
MTRYYVFQQRLKFKCEQNGVTFKMVDEYCTSKACSNCGNLKENLGGNHNYNCDKCGININRDIN